MPKHFGHRDHTHFQVEKALVVSKATEWASSEGRLSTAFPTKLEPNKGYLACLPAVNKIINYGSQLTRAMPTRFTGVR